VFDILFRFTQIDIFIVQCVGVAFFRTQCIWCSHWGFRSQAHKY